MIEFLLRSGDIRSGMTSPALLQQGMKIHRKIQAEAGDDYQPEVRLSCEMHFDDFTIMTEGIADGIIPDGQQPLIDEIKSTSMPLELIDEDYSVLHWAQAKCYGWMYLNQSGARTAIIRLTYCHSKTNEIKQFTKELSYSELKDYYTGLIELYAKWVGLGLNHRIKRMNPYMP